jgi:hypothetical protein
MFVRVGIAFAIEIICMVSLYMGGQNHTKFRLPYNSHRIIDMGSIWDNRVWTTI